MTRRERSVSESLLSIVLGLEAFLVFFVTLAAFGLKVLDPAPAFIGGAALIVSLILVSGLVRYRWGVWLGWVLQGVLVATGILLPIMFFIAAGFVGIWIYCFIKGGQLDRAKAAHFTNRPEETA
ncbi:MAG: DUF4233 domain-containing protein [Rhodoglobus sp.]|nr:DUF4233 domain-containing protein [Rhodoglobus sp.]